MPTKPRIRLQVINYSRLTKSQEAISHTMIKFLGNFLACLVNLILNQTLPTHYLGKIIKAFSYILWISVVVT